MQQQYAYFSELPVSAEFSKNGNRWIKQSSRTARIIKPAEYSDVWFYFAKRELCTVGEHSRIQS